MVETSYGKASLARAVCYHMIHRPPPIIESTISPEHEVDQTILDPSPFVVGQFPYSPQGHHYGF